MNTLTTKALTAHLLVTGMLLNRIEMMRNDRGQASTEYAGILFVIVAIITAVVAAVQTGIGEAIAGKITEAIGNVGT